MKVYCFETDIDSEAVPLNVCCYPKFIGTDLRTDGAPQRLKIQANNRRHLFLVGCCLLLAGFVVGWKAGRLLVVSANSETRRRYLHEKGTAEGPVRTGVLDSLRRFQEGYKSRDLKQVDAFMEALFSRSQDTTAIGTDFNEWATGYDSVARFIRTDWRAWGNVQLDVDEAVVSSSGDVAWLATTGTVSFADSSRPFRFTAVLTSQDSRWLFRKVQFQWDDRPASFSDLTARTVWSLLTLR